MTNGSTCECSGSKNCSCKHHKIVPAAILIVGIIFVLQSFSILPGLSSMLVFGVLLVIVGWMKIMGRKCKCC